MLFVTVEQPSDDDFQCAIEPFSSDLSRLDEAGSLVCEREGVVVSLGGD